MTRSKFKSGDYVMWESPFGPMFGIVEGMADDGRYAVNVAGWVHILPERNPTRVGIRTLHGRNLTLARKRSEDVIMGNILWCYIHLSPENLNCDGECSVIDAHRKGAALNRLLRALFTEIGRDVEEGEAYNWEDARRKAL